MKLSQLLLFCSLAATDARYLREKGRKLQVEDDTGSVDNDTGNEMTRGNTEIVQLDPFSVQIALTTKIEGISYEVTDIVTAWLESSFRHQLESLGYTAEKQYARLNKVHLLTPEDTMTKKLYTAKFKGGVIFNLDSNRTKSVPKKDLLIIQQVTLFNDTALVERLRASQVTGLGSAVVDVNAFLIPPEPEPEDDSSSNSLEAVIIGAIVVACVAFVFLLGAVFWAYRYDRSGDYASKNHNDRSDSDTALEESPAKVMPRNRNNGNTSLFPDLLVGGEGAYPESVISDSIISGSNVSEDISATLSQYYRSGMGKVDYSNRGMLSDAGSVSSMESYGYSLDDGGLSVPLPSDHKERIGGLPVAPDNLNDEQYEHMEDVQIPDLDMELANLDINLSPDLMDDEVDGGFTDEEFPEETGPQAGKQGSSFKMTSGGPRPTVDPQGINYEDKLT